MLKIRPAERTDTALIFEFVRKLAEYEKLLHAVGSRVGGHVVIGRLALQEQIPHAAADEVGLMPGAAKSAADFSGKVARRHGMDYAPVPRRRN